MTAYIIQRKCARSCVLFTDAAGRRHLRPLMRRDRLLPAISRGGAGGRVGLIVLVHLWCRQIGRRCQVELTLWPAGRQTASCPPAGRHVADRCRGRPGAAASDPLISAAQGPKTSSLPLHPASRSVAVQAATAAPAYTTPLVPLCLLCQVILPPSLLM